mgnify:CR=1 FL=1
MLKHSKITVCAHTALSQPSHIVTSLRSRPSVSIYWSGMSKIVQYLILFYLPFNIEYALFDCKLKTILESLVSLKMVCNTTSSENLSDNTFLK